MNRSIQLAAILPLLLVSNLSDQPPVESAVDTNVWIAWFGSSLTAGAAAGLVLLCVVAWGTNLVALPGNWFSVALLAIYAWIGPEGSRASIGVGIVVAAFAAALAGEAIEFAAAAFGAKQAGASRKSTVYALIGSIVGTLIGAVFGIPIPVIGSVVAAILFAGIGAAVGAMYGEWTDGRRWRENWSIGTAAFWGRTLGTVGKMIAGGIIVVLALAGVVL